MDLVVKLSTLITPVLDGLGYELVRVQVQGDRRRVVQIMADRADGKGMTVEDCARISRQVSAVMDVDDPISDPYTLEVSSPGIDRPLTRRKDFITWAGHEIKLEAREIIANRKRFTGLLLGLDETETAVLLKVEGETVEIPWGLIAKAKLVLTDALIKAVTVVQDNDTEIIEETTLSEEQD